MNMLVRRPNRNRSSLDTSSMRFLALWLVSVSVKASWALQGTYQIELGGEVGTAFKALDQGGSRIFAASVQDKDSVFRSPWHLDRVDQRNLPLDGQFSSQVCCTLTGS